MKIDREDGQLIESYANAMSINQLKGTIAMMKAVLKRRESNGKNIRNL